MGATGVGRALQSAREAGRFGRDEANDPALTESLRIANFQFNAHGVELGYCYDSGAVVHDDSTYTENPRDPVLYHHPTTRPGARVAHAWLARDGVALSSLDLVDGLSFALLIGSNREEWINAAAEVTRKLGVEVSPVRIGPGGVLDPNGDWARVREIDESGCVLVRPDRHVAWRSLSLADNPRDSLLQAMRAILSR